MLVRSSLALALAGIALACQGPPEGAVTPDGGILGRRFTVAAGAYHTCAIFAAGAVRCWGDNSFGQLGRAAGEDPLAAGATWIFGKRQRATGVFAGPYDTCAILEGGAVKCWGDNSFGQLGLGDTVTRGDGTGAMGDGLPAVDLGTGRRAVALALGNTATCALLRRRARSKCWGPITQGATGHGDIQTRGDRPGTMGDNLPTVDLGSRDGAPFEVKVMTAFDYHSFCAILNDTGPDNSGLKCWGSNDYCELGLGTPDSRDADPAHHRKRPRVGRFRHHRRGRETKGDRAGGRLSVDLRAGRRRRGRLLGNKWVRPARHRRDRRPRSCAPGEVGDANLVALAAPAVTIAARGQEEGDGAHACALLATGAVTCWGENSFGQLGTGDTTPLPRPSPPLAFADGFVPQTLVLGNQHTCALSADGRIKCWGSNQKGQLDPGVDGDRYAPGADLQLRGRAVRAPRGR